eukprot:7936865-Pyramimonas_sp.AAC.1
MHRDPSARCGSRRPPTGQVNAEIPEEGQRQPGHRREPRGAPCTRRSAQNRSRELHRICPIAVPSSSTALLQLEISQENHEYL